MAPDTDRLRAWAGTRRASLVAMTQAMVGLDTQTPPSATGAIAALTAGWLRAIPGVAVQVVDSVAPVVNVIATLEGGRPGPRLVLSGHLDTYPIGDAAGWTRDPLGAEVADGMLWGRGSADMKGGVAVLIETLRHAAEAMRPFAGSVVLVLAGDEERMGERGTQWLIDHMPEAVCGDAVMVADVGGPRAVRLGEKGMIWLALEAEGRAVHGAHVHAGVNAADRLIDAAVALRGLEAMAPAPPADAVAVMAAAARLPDADPPAARAVMGRVTVNLGRIEGGISANLVPAAARAGIDIRLPLGVSVAEAEARIATLLEGRPGLRWRVTRRYEASWTAAHRPIVRATLAGAARAQGAAPVWADMRIGGSDARLWRRAGMDCVVLGLTPHNLGAPDEGLVIDELPTLLASYAATLDAYLTNPS
ncbi:MAG: M20/M25/M40 family metallo-hydrolase [Alkalilacustris sp.]